MFLPYEGQCNIECLSVDSIEVQMHRTGFLSRLPISWVKQYLFSIVHEILEAKAYKCKQNQQAGVRNPVIACSF